MFTTYAYNTSALLSEMLSDITALLTGPGAEKVIDGTFSVAGLTDWTLGAGWADGTGKAAKNVDGVGTLTQAVDIPAVVGKKYRIQYQVLDWTVDGVTVTYGGQSDAIKSANGSYSFDITASTTGSLILTPSSTGSRFSIDNVSVKPLTGQVDKTALSASCNQAATTILSTNVAGWEVWDDATGVSNQTVFRALNADGSTYKYMMIDFSVANYLKTIVGESWDTGTNAWTNKANGSDNSAYSQRINTTNGGTLFIGATSVYVIIFSKSSAGVYGSSTGYAPCGIFERTRASGWDTAGAGYPPYVYGNWNLVGSATPTGTTYNFFAPRIKGQAGDSITTAAFLSPCIEFPIAGNFRGAIPTVRCFDTDLSWKHFMHEIAISNITAGWKAGKIKDIYVTTESWGAAEDTISYAGNTYFIMTENTSPGTGAGMRIAVPKF